MTYTPTALAVVAYQAYVEQSGGKAFDGSPLKTWEELPPHIQANWGAAATAVENAVITFNSGVVDEANEAPPVTNEHVAEGATQFEGNPSADAGSVGYTAPTEPAQEAPQATDAGNVDAPVEASTAPSSTEGNDTSSQTETSGIKIKLGDRTLTKPCTDLIEFTDAEGFANILGPCGPIEGEAYRFNVGYKWKDEEAGISVELIEFVDIKTQCIGLS